MKYIHFNRKTSTVTVTSAPQHGAINIRVAKPDFKGNPFHAQIPVASAIYEYVLYLAVEAEDRRQGREVSYRLVCPDPWLVALGLVMWEGIVQGGAWDTVKLSVKAALHTLRRKGV